MIRDREITQKVTTIHICCGGEQRSGNLEMSAKKPQVTPEINKITSSHVPLPPVVLEIPATEWKSSDLLTDQQIQAIFLEMDEKRNGWITQKEIEKRFIRFGKICIIYTNYSSFLLTIRFAKCQNSSNNCLKCFST